MKKLLSKSGIQAFTLSYFHSNPNLTGHFLLANVRLYEVMLED